MIAELVQETSLGFSIVCTCVLICHCHTNTAKIWEGVSFFVEKEESAE